MCVYDRKWLKNVSEKRVDLGMKEIGPIPSEFIIIVAHSYTLGMRRSDNINFHD